MKILSIGDIHGRDSWKFLTHGSPYEYNTWRTAVDAGADGADLEFWKEMPYAQFDKIIFVGDYVDSFKVRNIEMKHNLMEILHLKKLLGDRVVMLLGNHDVQYFVPDQICSGYRPEMKMDLYQIFTENADCFKLAHEEVSEDGKRRYLWTHAGITDVWLNYCFEPAWNDPKRKHSSILREHDEDSLADRLNLAFEMRFSNIFNVDSFSGGASEWAGPLWVRPAMLNNFSINTHTQIVGHTPQDDIRFVGERIYYIDVMEYGSGKGLELII